VGNIGVAIAWSGYFRELLSHAGLSIPAWLATDFRSANMAGEAVAAGATDAYNVYIASALAEAPRFLGLPVIANIPAVLIVVLITIILVIGIKESANSNTAMVLLKVGVVVFFAAVGSTLVRPENWANPALGGFAPNGWSGIATGAAIIFFSYIGFDATSTAAEEAKNPGRDMPFGIIMSLIICTVLYIVMAAVMTGMAPWNKLGTPEPMITALALADGSPRLLAISRLIVSLGAVVAMSSVLLVFQLGQPRIFMSMARDGLLPPFLARVHTRYRTPYVGTIITGVFVAFFAAFANIAEVVELTNIGTLFAFVFVSAGVLVLRRKEPNRTRPFRVPLVPLTPVISIIACTYLMLQLPLKTWIFFGLWLAIGMVIYVFYGMRHSRLGRQAERGDR
jgi:APA family basic amino acid/polyamine antiporter